MDNERPVQTSLNDPVLALLVNYFLPAHLMHDHYHFVKEEAWKQLDRTKKRGEEPPSIWGEFTHYMHYWLSALYVVVEGFLQLNLKNDRIERMISEHKDSLKVYRNGTFDYQRNPNKHVQFFQENRIDWAEDLHRELEIFFCDYTGVQVPDERVSFPWALLHAANQAAKNARREMSLKPRRK